MARHAYVGGRATLCADEIVKGTVDVGVGE
jgi:hypothetical protein